MRTALEGLEEFSDAEDPDSEAQAQPQASTAQESHDALTQQSRGNSLQKAGLVQRLKDLKAKRSQWKVYYLSIDSSALCYMGISVACVRNGQTCVEQ